MMTAANDSTTAIPSTSSSKSPKLAVPSSPLTSSISPASRPMLPPAWGLNQVLEFRKNVNSTEEEERESKPNTVDTDVVVTVADDEDGVRIVLSLKVGLFGRRAGRVRQSRAVCFLALILGLRRAISKSSLPRTDRYLGMAFIHNMDVTYVSYTFRCDPVLSLALIQAI
jgi:hypothetical protein